jgi:hypothetical protein
VEADLGDNATLRALDSGQSARAYDIVFLASPGESGTFAMQNKRVAATRC